MQSTRVHFPGHSNPDIPDKWDVSTDPSTVGPSEWRPLRGPFQRWPRLSDACLALLSLFLTFQMWPSLSDPDLDPFARAFAIGLAFAGNLAIYKRRSQPLVTHCWVLFCSCLVLFATPYSGLFAMAFSLYSLGRYEPRARLSFLGLLGSLLLASVDMFVFGSGETGSYVALGLIVSFWYVGRRLRFRGEYLRLLEERADYLERRKSEEAAQAVAQERARIAREMHDIVAHQVSLMTVQAGAAKTIAQSNPEAALTAMSAVEQAGRQAMTEMRHLLDVLRKDVRAAATMPQPGCADLPALVSEVTDAGTPVELRTEGRLSGLSSRLDLAIYRIVQEALTNVMKHAGSPAGALVEVRRSNEGVHIKVSDTGEGADQQNQPATGHGIAGMRERAQLLGGWLDVASATGDGFTVNAFLPLSLAADGAMS